MALCALFRLFNFMQEQCAHEHASWNSCMHFRIQCLSSFKNDFHKISYPQCRGGGGFKTAILQKPIWKQDLHPQGPLPWCQDLAHFLLGLLLCMGWPCDSYGPVHTFQTFQLQFFFRKFFLGPLYGALHCPQNIFHERGFFVEPLKNMIIRKPLSQKSRGFQEKPIKTCVHVIFH